MCRITVHINYYYGEQQTESMIVYRHHLATSDFRNNFGPPSSAAIERQNLRVSDHNSNIYVAL